MSHVPFFQDAYDLASQGWWGVLIVFGWPIPFLLPGLARRLRR